MPRDVNGNYSLPAGNPVVTATVISSTWSNTTLSDLATAMTNSLDRTGASAGMTGQFKATSGSVGAPGIAFGSELTSGLYRAAAGDFRFAISGVDAIKFAYANPSGTVGLTAVNGTSINPMRSDAAPALSQAIVPTWTGVHTFSATPVFNNGLTSNTGANTLNGSLTTTGVVQLTNMNGNVLLKANAAGSSAIAYLQFSDSAGVRKGVVGKFSGTDSDNWISSDAGNIRLLPVSGGSAVMTIDGGTNYFDIGWRDCPLNSQSTNYTTVLADRGKQISATTAAITLTIAANASVAYPNGTALLFTNQSSGSISIGINTDTLILAGTGSGGTRTLAQNGMATAVKINATQWLIGGPGLT